jgi:menaquinone-dependent protoporphyrinogen IX oxidase
MKTLVCYTSISGFTRRYAQWIAESLDADLLPLKSVRPETLDRYELIIYGGSLHAVGINGIRFIRKQLPGLKGRRVIVFAVGASPAKEGIVEEILQENFTVEEQKSITLFYLRGGFDYTKLDLPNKIIMTLLKLKIMLRNKKKRSSDERGMLAAYAEPADFTSRDTIQELLQFVRSL